MNVTMESFKVNLPKEFLPVIQTMEGSDVDAKVRVSLAIGLFAEKQVTLARAATLAEMPLAAFIDVLRSKNLPWLEYTEDHLKEDQKAIHDILKEEEK
ncbi:Uncharacterised protein family (UPF0175) [Salibacterium qingdaonense]|uniref:Uncharacterized protein family (UPF0175) n=2 Tax=Salibacterium qingdaonense TaxID=266892 RepID=A0A1I4P568_9BACI|nr:Uncharacterised protein family (UPF0175) [Salibacterium qingdaonense]